jgi:hypothetical protein
MSSIIKNGVTFHGICVCGRGVFTNDEYPYGRRTYVGQIRDGHACGLGVTTCDCGTKEFAEHGPDGNFLKLKEHGRILTRYAGGTTGYERQKRGVSKEYAEVHAYGACAYNDWACAPDKRRFLALIALVAPVEVRPSALAPTPVIVRQSPPSNRPMDRPARFSPRRHWRPPWPPR